MTILYQSILLVCIGTAAALQKWEEQWQFLKETCAWLHTLGLPRDAQKFDRLDLYRQQSNASAVVVFVGAAQSARDDLVQHNIAICALDSNSNPAVQQYALVGSIALLDTALREAKSIESEIQKFGFAFQSVHTTDRPR